MTQPTPSSAPVSVLFVCTANICRSPYMELAARHLASNHLASNHLAGNDPSVRFSGAGTHGFEQHSMDSEMASTLPAGVDTATFRSRPLTAAILADADLVLTAEASHRTRILEENPALFRKVFTLGQFAAAVPNHPGVRGHDLIRMAGMRRTPALAEHDVDDPYRQGAEACQAAAGTISTMLSVIVPALVED